MPRLTCRNCNGNDIYYDTGTGVCRNCGNVVEESAIVAEVTFGESSNGAAMAYGKNVPAGADRAGGGGTESREQVIANGRQKIREVARSMGLSSYIQEQAQRHFNLCVAINFIKGRSSQRVAAACLYISCREQKTSHMLIDFSDKLRVNVFELGATYTKLIRSLHLEGKLPLVDPAHYIGRFAAMLEFGTETQKVATDAARLVRRFDTDWLRAGRRPSGICGACILLAARMNNFRRSVEEIVQVVKIADSTIRKRLDEFKTTPSGGLTVQDFRSLWLEEENDPPAFTSGKEKRLRAEEAAAVLQSGQTEDENDGDDEEVVHPPTQPSKRKRDGSEERSRDSSQSPTSSHPYGKRNVDKQVLQPFPGPSVVDDERESFRLEDESFIETLRSAAANPAERDEESDLDYLQIAKEVEGRVQGAEQMVQNYMSARPQIQLTNHEPNISDGKTDQTKMESQLSESAKDPNAVSGDESNRQSEAPADAPVDLFEDIDDEELSRYLCTEEEVTRKTRLWVEFNKQYLEDLAAKGLDEQSGISAKKKRSKPAKPKDSTTAAGGTAAESARAMMEKKKDVSKRINYDAVSALLSTEVMGGKKNRRNRPSKENHNASRKKSKIRAVGSDGYESLGWSDGSGRLHGLERMSDPEDTSLGWAIPAASNSLTYELDDDGYDPDSYQQEA